MKLAASLSQPPGGGVKKKKTPDVTDSGRRVPRPPLPGCRGSAWWEREQKGAFVESRTRASELWLTACAVHGGLTGKHLVRIRSVLQHVHSCTHGWKQFICRVAELS